MTPAALGAAIPPCATILADTSTVVAYLSGARATSTVAVIDGPVASARNALVVSAITTIGRRRSRSFDPFRIDDRLIIES